MNNGKLTLTLSLTVTQEGINRAAEISKLKSPINNSCSFRAHKRVRFKFSLNSMDKFLTAVFQFHYKMKHIFAWNIIPR